MNKVIVFFSLFSSSFFGMEIERIEPLCNEQTPLLSWVHGKREIDIEAGIHLPGYHTPVSNYLDKLPPQVRYQLTKYFRPQQPAMHALLQNISFEPDQALELYKKFAFYKAIPQLPKLVKATTRKQIKESSKEYIKTLYPLHQRLRTAIIDEDEEVKQLKNFLDNEIMALAALEQLNLNTVTGSCEKLFNGKKIIQHTAEFERITERDAKIADASVLMYKPRSIYFRLNALGTTALLVIMATTCFAVTHFSINKNDFLMICANRILANCSSSEYGCNSNEINKAFNYCNVTMHIKEKNDHRHNIKTWSFFCVGLSALMLLQIAILCARCIKPSYTINPHAKELVEQYKAKITTLENNLASS